MVGPYNYGETSNTAGPPEFVNEQVTIYKDGAVSTAQKGLRSGETVSELNRKLVEGWSTTAPESTESSNPRTASQGYNLATTLFGFKSLFF